jgi:hypothetical protein
LKKNILNHLTHQRTNLNVYGEFKAIFYIIDKTFSNFTPNPPPFPYRIWPNRRGSDKKELFFDIFKVAGFPLPRYLRTSDLTFLV